MCNMRGLYLCFSGGMSHAGKRSEATGDHQLFNRGVAHSSRSSGAADSRFGGPGGASTSQDSRTDLGPVMIEKGKNFGTLPCKTLHIATSRFA
jgi:hypothetical protein